MMKKRKNNLQFRLEMQKIELESHLNCVNYVELFRTQIWKQKKKKEEDIPLRLNLLNLCNLKKNESKCYWVVNWQSVHGFVGY